MNQDLLHKYFKGETSVDEEKRILNWVDESEENRKTLQKERMPVSYTHLTLPTT